MCAERAAQALRVGAVVEGVQRRLRVASRRVHARRGHERLSVQASPHHGARELLARARLAAGVTIERLPEPGHVLAQLPDDEVAAVTAQVAASRRVLGTRQDPLRVAIGLKQRPGRVQTVLVRVAEQILAQATEVEVRVLGGILHRPPAVPVHLGLRDAVDEPERLGVPHMSGEAVRDLKALTQLRFDGLLQSLQLTRQRIQQHRGVGHALTAPPAPARRIVRALVPQTSRAARVPGHAFDELRRERADDLCRDTQGTQSLAGKRHLQRGARGRLPADGIGERGAAEPGARRGAVGDPQEEKHRLGVVLVGEPRQPLDIIQLDRRRCGAHSSSSHAAASRSLTRVRSSPARMRALRVMLMSVRPG